MPQESRNNFAKARTNKAWVCKDLWLWVTKCLGESMFCYSHTYPRESFASSMRVDEFSSWPREVFKSQFLQWRALQTYPCSAVSFVWNESIISTDSRIVSHMFTGSDQIRLLSTWKKTTKKSSWWLRRCEDAWEQASLISRRNWQFCQEGNRAEWDGRGWYGEGNWWLSWKWLAGWSRALPHHSCSQKTFQYWCCVWDLHCLTSVPFLNEGPKTDTGIGGAASPGQSTEGQPLPCSCWPHYCWCLGYERREDSVLPHSYMAGWFSRVQIVRGYQIDGTKSTTFPEMGTPGDSFRRKVEGLMTLILNSPTSYPPQCPPTTANKNVVQQWWQLLWLWSPPSQGSSLPLSHSETHMQIMQNLEKPQLRHRAEQNQADVSCSAKVALQSLQIQNICFFSPTTLTLQLFFEVISLTCLLERAGGGLLNSVLNILLH